MIRPSQALRLAHINFVLTRHGLAEIILATHLFRPLRFLIYFLPSYWLRGVHGPRGVRIRRALESLGPMFVKFGQLLSTRRDLLPEDIAVELAKLQDQVPPFPGARARAIVEAAYGRRLEVVFASFDETPLASASVAQVHAATLHDGRQVVLKVLRPHIERVIRRDIGLMYAIAGLAQRYWPDGRRLRPKEVVAEYEKTIFDELDLLREAANCAQLRRNFQGSDMLYVPEVMWSYTRRTVLVMERISGIPVSDIESLRAHGVDLKHLSEMGVEIFYTQVFRDNFFHADMHPGNIFVSPQGTYIAVDFGIVGTLTSGDQRYLAENFLAFFNRDYHRVAELHVESGWVPPETRVDEFESAIRSVCEPIFGRPLKEISFGHLLVRLFQTARRFNMEVQPQLVLLQKTLLNIEGLGRQLYPELDLWITAKPFLERWMAEQVGSKGFLRGLRTQAPRWAETLPEMPALAYDVLRRARDGKLRVHTSSTELELLRRELRRASRRSFAATVGSALLISAAIIKGLDGYSAKMWGDLPALSWVLGGVGLWLVLVAWPTERD